jgi:integrase
MWLNKKITTVWLDSQGRRVPPKTAGAKRKRIKSKKWYAFWKENGRKQAKPLATDKQVAQALMGELIRQQERGQANLIDPFKQHLDRSFLDHLTDYMAVVRSTSRSEDHHAEVERVLTKIADACGFKTLRDLTADRVQQYLTKLECSATTTNKHRTYVVTFCNYLVGVNRLPVNPINRFSVKRATPKEGEQKRKRQALKPTQVKRLLEAVAAYPVAMASVNKGGRNAKINPVTRPAKLSDETIELLKQRGRERRLLYRIALLTGLRRQEIARLRVMHFEPANQPDGHARFVLPGTLTKNKKPATIMLASSLAEELSEWIKATNRRPHDPLLYVPCKSNLARLHKAHLAMAGIEYKDERGRYADFHSMRVTANVLLRHGGIEPKERQLFMRHGKLELTTEIYDDEKLTAMEDVVRVLQESGL